MINPFLSAHDTSERSADCSMSPSVWAIVTKVARYFEDMMNSLLQCVIGFEERMSLQREQATTSNDLLCGDLWEEVMMKRTFL